MLIKPPTIPGIENVEKPQGLINKPLIRNDIIENNDHKVIKQNASILSNNENPKDLIIRNKKAYKRFIKLVKTGKFTTAMLSAKLIGVQRNTIMEWLKTKAVMAVMNEEINTYISKISGSKDWKAQAYLLDKTLGDDDKEKDTTVQLTNLIQINTTT